MSLKRRIVDTILGIIPYLPDVNEDWIIRQTATACFIRSFHKIPDLNGVTFNEKVFRSKIKDRNPMLPRLADKILVKEYVATALGSEWIIPTIWSGPDISTVDLTKIRKPFVVKANHGCGWNIFVRSDSELDVAVIRAQSSGWLKRKYRRELGEWCYEKIEPQILIEPFVGDAAEFPIDYKLFVFAGKAQFIQVDTGRENGHKRCFYDRAWKKQPFGLKYPIESRELTRPHALDAMIGGAEKLAEGFDFVRVDLYEIDGKPLFGELTFYPGSGLVHFNPSEWDEVLGRYWP